MDSILLLILWDFCFSLGVNFYDRFQVFKISLYTWIIGLEIRKSILGVEVGYGFRGINRNVDCMQI